MAFKKVVVAGGGVLGSQIALQTQYCGFDVTIWLRSEASIDRYKPKLEHDKQLYLASIEQMSGPRARDFGVWAYGIASPDSFDAEECKRRIETAYSRLTLETDLGKAVADADLVSQSPAA